MHLRFKQRIVAAVALLSLKSLMTRATPADEGRLKLDVNSKYRHQSQCGAEEFPWLPKRS